MNIAVIQTRYDSTRFLGKALALFCGKPLTQFIYDRVRPVVDDVVVATTHESQPIIDYCEKNGIKYVVGKYHDCVGRLLKAARLVNADLIVRLWGDSPLISPEDIKEYLNNMGDSDFGTTMYPLRIYPKGMDFEVYTMNCLETLDKKTKGEKREFIMPYILKRNYKVLNIAQDFCIDYPEDIERVERAYRRIYPTEQV